MLEVSQVRDAVPLALLMTPKYHRLPHIMTADTWVLPASLRVPPDRAWSLATYDPAW